MEVTFMVNDCIIVCSLVPRPLYFAGVENEGLVFTVHACV